MREDRSRDEFIEAAIHQFEKPLVGYALHIVGDLDRARDVVQETFLRLLRMEPAKVRDRLAPWLYTVCRNLALDARRKEARMRPLTDPVTQNAVSREPAPPGVVQALETRNAVLAAVDSLPPRQREAVRLKFQQGLRYRDIAEVMDTTVSNVGYLIHVGIHAIRKRLSCADAGIEEGDPT